jgi:hypothetical protein
VRARLIQRRALRETLKVVLKAGPLPGVSLRRIANTRGRTVAADLLALGEAMHANAVREALKAWSGSSRSDCRIL